MEKIIILFIFFLPIYSGAQPATEYFSGGSRCTSGSWEIIFEDDFNGNQLDTSKWTTYFPYGPDNSDQCQFCRTHDTSWSRQIFKDENVLISDGFAHLISREEPAEWMGVKSPYSTGMIHSKQAFTDYAKFEIRCKIPQGELVLPAFWVFGWSTEIDAFELTNENLSEIMMSVHKWSDNTSRSRSGFMRNFNYSDDFHVYSIVYEKDFVRFYIDGRERYKISRYIKANGRDYKRCRIRRGEYLLNPVFPVYGNPVQLIANSSIASYRSPEGEPGKIFGNFMIDYIRVYQRSELRE